MFFDKWHYLFSIVNDMAVCGMNIVRWQKSLTWFAVQFIALFFSAFDLLNAVAAVSQLLKLQYRARSIVDAYAYAYSLQICIQFCDVNAICWMWNAVSIFFWLVLFHEKYCLLLYAVVLDSTPCLKKTSTLFIVVLSLSDFIRFCHFLAETYYHV